MNKETIYDRGPFETLCYKVATSPKSKVVAGILGIGLPATALLGGCELTQNPSVIEQVSDQTPIPLVIATAQAQATQIAQYSQDVRDSRATQTVVANAAATAESQRRADKRNAEATATAIVDAARQNPEWVEKQKRESDIAFYVIAGGSSVFLSLMMVKLPSLLSELEELRRKRRDEHE